MSDDRSRDSQTSGIANDAPGPDESWYGKLLTRLGLKSRELLRDDLEDVLSETAEDPAFSPQERAMLKNVLGFHRIRVDDVMVPRADIVAVPVDMELCKLMQVFRAAGHSRLPTYGETLDDPKGMVHIRDFLDYITESAMTGEDEAQDLAKVDLTKTVAEIGIQREILFVPGSMPAVDLLVKMQAMRTHIALVIDEYGGTDGLVSIEDLIETVVGDIEDEHDDEESPSIVQTGQGTFIVDARADLDEVSEAIGVDLTAEADVEDIDTFGGFIVTVAGRVPSRSELIPGPEHMEFEILDADPRRVKRVRIHRRTPEPNVSSSAPAPETAASSGQTGA